MKISKSYIANEQTTLQFEKNVIMEKSSENGNLSVKSLNLLAILGFD